jgi:hypothetical protein
MYLVLSAFTSSPISLVATTKASFMLDYLVEIRKQGALVKNGEHEPAAKVRNMTALS